MGRSTTALEGDTDRKVGACLVGDGALYPVGVVFLIGDEVVVVGVVVDPVALLARIDLNPPVGVDSIQLLTGDTVAPVDLRGLATCGDTNCIGFDALVGLGDRRRCRWSILTGACLVGLGARTGGFSGLRGSFTWLKYKTILPAKIIARCYRK